MKEATRRKRAILRNRRLDNRDEALYGPPLIRAMTGWDLYLIQQRDRVGELAKTLPPFRTDDPFRVLQEITLTEE